VSLALALDRTKGCHYHVNVPWFVSECAEDTTDDRRFWLTKGLGSGGTYGGAMWHYMKCLQNPKSRFSWAIAPTFQHVADTLLPTFAEVFQNEFHLTEGVDYRIIASGRPRIELLKRKQEIWLKSANRPDRFVGPSVSHVFGTEVGLWKREAYEKSSARLRCPKATHRQYLGEGTPEGFNWWEKEANFTEGINEERNARRIILHTSDNTHLKPGYVDQLRRAYEYDPAKLESYLYGRFVSFTKGTAYWEFVERRNIKLDLSPSPFLPVLLCFDFNKSPIAWVAAQRQPHEVFGQRYNRFAALAESTGKSRGLQDACAEFISAFPPQTYSNTRIEIYGDCSGYAGHYSTQNDGYQQIQAYLRDYYRDVVILAARSAPRIQHRLERTAALMTYELLVVAAWCRNLIKAYKLTNLKDGNWDIEKPNGETWTHWAEALDYPLYQLTKGEDLARPSRKQVYGINKQI
jgi:hypothetical protein